MACILIPTIFDMAESGNCTRKSDKSTSFFVNQDFSDIRRSTDCALILTFRIQMSIWNVKR